MGSDVAACNDGLGALELARTESFDLMLVDCHMPGAGALAIVHALRTDPLAASHAAAVVATSAELAAGERHVLLAAGCSGILDKPCTLAELRGAIASIPGMGDAVLVLDDDAGLRSSGDYATLDALRQLLHDELAVLDRQLEAAGGSTPDLADRLHRLRAACGFCGTTRLARAAQKLKLELDRGGGSEAGIRDFHLVLADTLHALRRRLQASASRTGHGQHMP